ncbi:MAG TPA: DNA alkylation repair protein [Mucilaginibacter sp.]|jgi:3-methyladenine DNA glycosylase AlkD|nr:DNA alkylation repair protein [Mucilaginibacter sp.]
MTTEQVIEQLKQKADERYHTGMMRFGIKTDKALGVKVPELRKMAKAIKKDHELALQLWDTGIHEARILATMIADPAQVTAAQIDAWVNDFDSWDVCDQACGNLFDRTPYAIEKALEFSASEQEFVKRAGFVLMAEYAVHHKKADDEVFIQFFPIIEREAWDDRNFVKKAVNWALRQIGKRNSTLKNLAIGVAKNIALQNHRVAKWIASNALAELQKPGKK